MEPRALWGDKTVLGRALETKNPGRMPKRRTGPRSFSNPYVVGIQNSVGLRVGFLRSVPQRV